MSRMIDAETIRWTDISENGTHQSFNMVCFKDQIDKMPTITKEDYISVTFINEFAKDHPECRDALWKLFDDYYDKYLSEKLGGLK